VKFMKNQTKKVTFLGVMTTLAMILSYLELLLPPIWSAVPGIKVGLPNIIIIFLLYKLSFKDAVAVSFIRVCLTALLFGNVMSLVYSISGAVLSLAVMFILKKTDRFSMVGVSVAGGVCHNLGQIIAAIIVMQTKEIGYYMIVLSITGIIAGIFVGLAGALCLKYSKKLKIF